MAIAAMRAIAKHTHRRSCGGTPHPNLPPQGGKGLFERFIGHAIARPMLGRRNDLSLIQVR
jgi:hypothetical protein